MSSTKPASSKEKHQNQVQDEKEPEKCIKDLKLAIKKVDKAIAKEGENLSRMQAVYDADKLHLDTLVTKIEHQESSLASYVNYNKVKSTEHDNRREENMNLQRELCESQDLLMKAKLSQSTLFQMSPPWWQEAQNLKDQKAKDPQNEQNSGSEEATDHKGLNSEPSESTMPSTQEDDVLTVSSNLLADNQSSTEHFSIPKMPEIFFSDAAQAYESVSDLVRSILFLRENTKDCGLQKDVEAKRRQMNDQDEELRLQVTEMKAKIEREKEKAERFRGQVESHKQEKDHMEVLDEELTSVLSLCGVRRLTSFSTVEKMKIIEKHVLELITQTEKIPVEYLKRERQKNLRMKRKREQEERLRLQMEAHREKIEKYKEKAIKKTLKTTRKMPMPRSNPDYNKVKVVSEPAGPAKPQQEDLVSSFYELHV
ncbi:cilia- and flagella-associated protein 100 isoform X2 [Nothobranchius furzeri]|uniref:Transcript variant X1 n=2 Tax=Nothobranchius furzeri TaxID=105023 RepID=A0A9D2YFY5_NOTFU|nr:transcript variant X2 [Nothobranchius furzeri]KAF7219784.1 transcript variant X3 [Nothobranchius furzeri]KAF7219786.1 transcript variant X1 [Nothobranchius furzeri]KAF7219787.1 transcript variant X4 [Nothobranchius furzeri]